MGGPNAVKGGDQGVGQDQEIGQYGHGVHADPAAEGTDEPLQQGVDPQRHGQTLEGGHDIADRRGVR